MLRAKHSQRWGTLIVLFMGGGSIYILPYLNSYFYIPMKEAMRLNNTQLGMMVSVMGFASMIFYWPGGWLADRFSLRKLLTFSFVANGLLGLWLSTFPPFRTLMVIEVLMGISLTLIYWSALIKSTRQLALGNEQGRFFGLLEGGRNLTAVAVGAAGLAVFARASNHISGLRWAIILFSMELFVLGALTWVFVRDQTGGNAAADNDRLPLWESIVTVVKIPAVWLVMMIILCAYVTSVGITYLTPYATDVYKQTVVFGGMLYTLMQWSSVFASPAAGFVADRTSTSGTTLWLLLLLAFGLLLFAFINGSRALFYLLLINSISIGCAIYALRGIYYALLEEGSIPLRFTGAATGLISLVAYTPDVFVPILAGHLLDKYAAGGLGYKYFFLIMGAFALAGVALTILFRKMVKRRVTKS